MQPSQLLIRVSVSYKLGEYITILRECVQLHEANEPARTWWLARLWNSQTMQNVGLALIAPPLFLVKKALAGTCTFEFTTSGLTRISRYKRLFKTWDEVKFVHELPSSYLVELNEGFLPVPYRTFSPEQRSEFRRLVPAHVQRSGA